MSDKLTDLEMKQDTIKYIKGRIKSEKMWLEAANNAIKWSEKARDDIKEKIAEYEDELKKVKKDGK